MSASKDAAWSRDPRAWRDVSPSHRCPVCRSDSWCQVHRVEPVVLCKRVQARQAKANRDGVPFYVHRLDGDAWEPEALPPPAADVACAGADVCDAAYRAALGGLGLTDAHRANLHARGLSDAAIEANGYRSLPLEGRAKLARRMLDAVGDAACAVPGYRLAEGDGRTWATLGGAPGLLVPVRDLEGRIVALKVRRDDLADDGPRYVYVSSRSRGGAAAPNAVHVPRWRGATTTVRLTEGELKADVCTALSGVLTLSAPGVGAWARAMPVLRALGPATVRVAFDADAFTNAHVAAALAACCDALRRAGYVVAVERWNPARGKGLDDVLAARATGRAA